MSAAAWEMRRAGASGSSGSEGEARRAPAWLDRLSVGVVAFLVLVILWGAYVRASGSGAGCGSHWPTCNGEVIPRGAGEKTLIEFTHRATSGLAGLLVLAQTAGIFVVFRRGHPARLGGALSLFFLVVESLLGAGLVVFEYVAKDERLARGYWVAAHLVNTLLLLAVSTLTAFWVRQGARLSTRNSGSTGLLLGLTAFSLLAVGASGAVAALGDTLFPASSVAEGIAAELSAGAHVFVRLRILHPFLALASGALVVATAALLGGRAAPRARLGKLLVSLVVVQLGAGVLNVALLAPVWLQLAHLALADALWIAFVLFTAEALRR